MQMRKKGNIEERSHVLQT